MKTKIIHHITLGFLLAQTMCLSVILSHTHLADVVALLRPEPAAPGSTIMTTLSTSDIHSKALGDLHHHIDKTSVKNMSAQTAAARKRDLQPNTEDITNVSIGQSVYDFLLRICIVFSLLFSTRSLVLEDI